MINLLVLAAVLPASNVSPAAEHGNLAASSVMAQALSVTADEMKVALRTERKEEDGFIEDVVDRVVNPKRPADERLPAEMVEGTFQWARQKAYYRFQYFKRGLTLRAAKIGVKL
jgi:hypothetical protein